LSFWRKDVVQPALDHDVEAAIADQLAILHRNPDSAPAHFALGTLAHFRGDTDSAVRLFERAAVLDPAYAAPHVSLGRIYIVKGAYDEAWRHAREAERLGDRSLLEQLERYPKLKGEG